MTLMKWYKPPWCSFVLVNFLTYTLCRFPQRNALIRRVPSTSRAKASSIPPVRYLFRDRCMRQKDRRTAWQKKLKTNRNTIRHLTIAEHTLTFCHCKNTIVPFFRSLFCSKRRRLPVILCFNGPAGVPQSNKTLAIPGQRKRQLSCTPPGNTGACWRRPGRMPLLTFPVARSTQQRQRGKEKKIIPNRIKCT